MSRHDVIVVGAGNAGMCAACAAAERGASVLVLDRAPEPWSGGNSWFTAGAIRTAHSGRDDLADLLAEDEPRLAATDLDPYPPEAFAADMRRLTLGRCDAALTDALVADSANAVRWLRDLGVRFRLMYDRQAYEVGGRWRFWGGLALGTVDGGKGLVRDLRAAAERAGVRFRFDTTVDRLLRDADGAVRGVAAGEDELAAGAVVLAAGGFQADRRLRAQYLGPNWDLAKVRGTPYNTGAALLAALAAGAQAAGHWSGCHSVAWDAGAPEHGDRGLTNRYTKQSYPLSLVVNAEGRRFLDEGADTRNYTYAKYGAEILRQPGALAFQLFDARTSPYLRPDEYDAPGVSSVRADRLDDLAVRAGIDPVGLAATVADYNAGAGDGAGFDPSVKDRVATRGVRPPKSNWALPLDRPPFAAFAVTCGITFTYGGVKIDTDGRVLDADDAPIPGLLAAGETVGGLFHYNYPGGSGLTAGTVFGRRVGARAAEPATLAGAAR